MLHCPRCGAPSSCRPVKCRAPSSCSLARPCGRSAVTLFLCEKRVTPPPFWEKSRRNRGSGGNKANYSDSQSRLAASATRNKSSLAKNAALTPTRRELSCARLLACTRLRPQCRQRLFFAPAQEPASGGLASARASDSLKSRALPGCSLYAPCGSQCGRSAPPAACAPKGYIPLLPATRHGALSV